MRDRRAVRRVALAAVDERMAVELVADGAPDGAGAAAVDDTDRRQTRERGVVDERPNGLARVLCAVAAHVELVGDVASRGRDDPDRRLAVIPLAAGGRTQAREREAQPVPCRPDHLGLVALDRCDRAVNAEARCLDGIAGRKRPGQRQRLIECTQRLLCLRRTGRSGAEPAVSVTFGANSGCR